MLSKTRPDEILDTALEALRSQDDWRPTLDGLKEPAYVTDPDGAVTYWNRACADFAGREPELGKDRWCISWHIYSISGDPIPHDQCPMARAVREGREVRDEIVIVERPDGRRRACRVYPTPWLDDSGEVQGAVNLLIDVTDEQADSLTEQASRCRRLARATTDPRACDILGDMANGYAATARTLKSDR